MMATTLAELEAMDVWGDSALEDEPARRLIDAHDCGAMLSVPASWVLAQARRDAIPHVRLGRYVRFDPQAVEAWWQARARGPK